MLIEKWWYDQNFNTKEKNWVELGSDFLSGRDFKIMSETQKALNVLITTDYGKLWKWIPKSVMKGGD